MDVGAPGVFRSALGLSFLHKELALSVVGEFLLALALMALALLLVALPLFLLALALLLTALGLLP